MISTLLEGQFQQAPSPAASQRRQYIYSGGRERHAATRARSSSSLPMLHSPVDAAHDYSERSAPRTIAL